MLDRKRDLAIDCTAYLFVHLSLAGLPYWNILKAAARDSESGIVHRSYSSVCPFVCLSVCRQNAKKRNFLKN